MGTREIVEGPTSFGPARTEALRFLLELDVQLMCRVRAGDMHAFTVLAERHRRPLIHFLQRMTQSESVAEELAQEVFLRVYRARGSYEPTAKFTTWLFRIASHAAINWIRDRRLEGNRESLDEADAEGARSQLRDRRPTIEQTLLEGATAREIREAISRLSSNQRSAVIMHKYREMGYSQIAAELHCSESAVKSLLFRAYEHLRETLAHFDRNR